VNDSFASLSFLDQTADGISGHTLLKKRCRFFRRTPPFDAALTYHLTPEFLQSMDMIALFYRITEVTLMDETVDIRVQEP
jgi:hypothetical protein